MAKPSKTRQVEGDDDRYSTEHMKTKTHSLPPEELRPSLSRTDSAYSELQRGDDGYSSQARLYGREDGEDEEDVTLQRGAHRDTDDADDERRESVFTSASMSSLPESAFEIDPEHENGVMHKPYTPMMIRPAFRRPESVRRLQMSSPTPSERSLRPSLLSSQRVRTPNSGRSSAKGSPRRPKWAHEEEEEEEEQKKKKKEYPLVLLHMTLLPIELRWSKQTMEELLPGDTLESLQLLKSRLSSTILQRGILIPHPQDEYELLEERLLEALELKTERVTKCGHFRARESTSSASSEDSGVGSSVEDVDEGTSCRTCHRHLSAVSTAVGGGRKWSIKVFAANGLMRASAWTAAWSEMESVDIEILPWIDEHVHQSLDARRLKEEVEENARQEAEMRRIATTADEQFRVERVREAQMWEEQDFDIPPADDEFPVWRKADDLPPVYPRKDIPLSLLLRNYVFLLAQDKRNVLLVSLTLLTLFFSLRASSLPPVPTSLSRLLPPPPPISEHMNAPLLPTLQHPSSNSRLAVCASSSETAVEEEEKAPSEASSRTEISASTTFLDHAGEENPPNNEASTTTESRPAWMTWSECAAAAVVEDETPAEIISTNIAAVSTFAPRIAEEEGEEEEEEEEEEAASIVSTTEHVENPEQQQCLNTASSPRHIFAAASATATATAGIEDACASEGYRLG